MFLMYSLSYRSLSDGAIQYPPRTWASPAMPGLTLSRWENPGASRANRSARTGRSGRGPTRLMSPLRMLTTWGISSR